MDDRQLKESVMHSHGYIDARYRALDPSEALKGVPWSDVEDLTSLSNVITDVIREIDDPLPALRAMESSSYPAEARSYTQHLQALD